MVFKLTISRFALTFLSVMIVLPISFTLLNAGSQAESQESRALHLNTVLTQELQQLDDINSTLQYLGQAINKGTVTVKRKKETLDWIKDQQATIRDLIALPAATLEENQLATLGTIIKFFILHISQAVESKFTVLREFSYTPEVITRSRGAIRSEALDTLIQTNNELIFLFKENAYRAGLTAVNIVARKLDRLNDSLGITKTLSYTPLAAALGTFMLYFAPSNWFELGRRLHSLSDIKQRIGEGPFSAQAQRQNQRNTHRGWVGRALDFVEHKDTKGTVLILGGLGVLTLWKSKMPKEYQEYLEPVNAATQFIRNKWEKLKGFNGIEAIPQYDRSVKITLDDDRLVGLESQTAQLRKLVQYITDPEIYDRSNANLEKGILLVGPSRSGKTYAARALHGSINKALEEQGSSAKFGFREIKWADVTQWSNDGIKTVLDEAKRNAPCVLFIDELHNLPLQTKEGGKTLTDFLTGMSGLNSENDAKHQVILLAATNQPEMLDFALLQPGRFGTIIHFDKPTYEQRKKYFEVIFKHNALDNSNMDLESLARQTENCSYGDLEFIVKQARFTARSQAKGVTQKHLQEQINAHVRRFKTDLPLTNHEKKVLSAHQAGHALASILLEPQERFEAVTILGRYPKIKEKRFWDAKQLEYRKAPTVKYGGLFTYNPAEVLKLKDAQEQTKQCMILLAGALAEKILVGSSQAQHHQKDKQKALHYSKQIALDGLPEDSLPKKIRESITEQAYTLLKKLEQDTLELLNNNKQLLIAIAQALETENTVTANDIKKIRENISL